VQPLDHRNITGEYNPTVHGFDGMTLITPANLLLKPFDEKIFAAADELRGNFEFNLDMNSGTSLGTGKPLERL
jgi:choline dehydrogenase